jgi:hypothetical protein
LPLLLKPINYLTIFYKINDLVATNPRMEIELPANKALAAASSGVLV